MGSNTSAPIVNNDQVNTFNKPYTDMSLNEKLKHHTENVKKLVKDTVNDPVGTVGRVAKTTTDAASKGVSYLGKAAITVTNTANVANTAVDNIRSIGQNAVKAIKNTGNTLTESYNNIKKTTPGISAAGEKKFGGVLETLIYGEENNSPKFYKPNNTKTILVVILFLLLIIVLIVMYYYSTSQIESFSIKKLFSRRNTLFHK